MDSLFKKVPFLDHCKQRGGIEYEEGGIKIQRPLSVVEHSSITELATGYEPVSLAVSDVLRPAVFDWEDFTAPVVITKKEELENQSEKAIVKIVEARMRSVMGLLKREMNRQILAGNSTVLGSLNTLNGIRAVNVTGFLEEGAPAPATQTNTVGGLAKNVLDVRGFYNQSFDGAGSFSANGLAGMFELYTKANSVAPGGSLSLILASEEAFINYKRDLQAQERYVDAKTLDGGRMSLAFHGIPVEQDPDMPDATVNGAGLAASMYFLNFEDGIKLCVHRDADFSVMPFEHVSGTTARAAYVYWKGQMVADHLGSQGVMYDADTY